MTLMNKREAYQLLYSLASANNEAFRIRIPDEKGRCRTYGGKAGHTKPRADFLKELTQFQNSINNVKNTPQIDITIPDFVTRPEPITKPKTVISSKYNKTCKCRITKYDSPCTYYSGWNNNYWTTKGSQLKQYREMIDSSFEKIEIEMINEQKRQTQKSIQSVTFGEQTNSGDFNETPITDINLNGGCSECTGTKSVDPIPEGEKVNGYLKMAGIATFGIIGLLLYSKEGFK
jgi:hypothetical protein